MLAEPRTLIDELLAEQGALSAVERFSRLHDQGLAEGSRYARLLPQSRPGQGQQYSFEVDLDQCSGCKACVTACHSMNGLLPNEAWRDVGQLVSRSANPPRLQTVTTACHHCLDPGCLNGCPVLAYEKDPETGIVHHLDDQCMGCQYCVLKCPYDVPKYSGQLGIVRKCDMCSQRLENGEAPACVQACPNEAIRIRLVDVAEIAQSLRERPEGFLPDAPDGRITLPTTRFVRRQEFAVDTAAVNADEPRLQPPHWPLVWMLVLTQMGIGTWWAALAERGAVRNAAFLLSLALTAAGVIASVFHLGQPLKAWRAFLGFRKSWMSREILAFSLFLPAGLSVLLLNSFGRADHSSADWLPGAVAALGGLAVLCSGMIYHDTQRPTWRGGRSLGRFLLTSALLGSLVISVVAAAQEVSAAAWPWIIAGLALIKVGLEYRWLRVSASSVSTPLHQSARLQWRELPRLTWARLAALLVGGLMFPVLIASQPPVHIAAASLALCWFAETTERYVFFRTMVSARMPGV